MRRSILALTLASGLAIGGVAPAQAESTPTITVVGGRTQPVFSYQDAVREHVYVEAPIDSDGDGRNDRVNVDIIRPQETARPAASA